MKLYKLLGLLIVTQLIGCAASGPLFKNSKAPLSDEALVYIYRPDSFALGGRDSYFFINDIDIIELSNNGYTFFYLPKGSYKLKQEWAADISTKSLEIDVSLRPRETAYFRFTTSLGSNAFYWRLSRVSPQDGMSEIKTTRFQQAFEESKAGLKIKIGKRKKIEK